jgi:hypothetical protein
LPLESHGMVKLDGITVPHGTGIEVGCAELGVAKPHASKNTRIATLYMTGPPVLLLRKSKLDLSLSCTLIKLSALWPTSQRTPSDECYANCHRERKRRRSAARHEPVQRNPMRWGISRMRQHLRLIRVLISCDDLSMLFPHCVSYLTRMISQTEYFLLPLK